jgi:hypothetical protein
LNRIVVKEILAILRLAERQAEGAAAIRTLAQGMLFGATRAGIAIARVDEFDGRLRRTFANEQFLRMRRKVRDDES